MQQIMDGTVAEPGTWVRLQGTTVELDESPTEDPGRHGILADAFNPLRSIVVEGDVDVAIDSPTNVTGHLAEAVVTVDVEALPIEATVAGTPPRSSTTGSSSSTMRCDRSGPRSGRSR